MPVRPDQPVRVFSRDSVRRLDARAIVSCGITGQVLMERAATGAAALAQTMLGRSRRVVICCGTGNNGGDGWAMARLLHEQRLDVQIVAPDPPRPGSDAAVNAQRADALDLPIVDALDEADEADLLIDALLGTGIDRPIEGAMAVRITAINDSGLRVLALDLPSGLDADTGLPLGMAVRAAATATLAGWKTGFLNRSSRGWTGPVHVVDLGIPDEVMAEFGDVLGTQAASGHH